jgi:hypothetical protein
MHEGKTLLYCESKLNCNICPLKPQCCPKVRFRKIPRHQHEAARDIARSFVGTEAFEQSRRECEKIEMRSRTLEAHPETRSTAIEWSTRRPGWVILAAIAQNLRRLATLVARRAGKDGHGYSILGQIVVHYANVFQVTILALQCSFYAFDQVIYFKRLSEQTGCTGGGRPGFKIEFRVRGNQYNWNLQPSGCKPSHQVQPTHAGHMNICDNAIERFVCNRTNIVLRGGVSISSISERGQRIYQRHSEGLVIVDDCDFEFSRHLASLPRIGLMSRTKHTLACTYSRRNHTRVLHLALGLVEHQRAGDPLGPAGVARKRPPALLNSPASGSKVLL